MILYLQTNSLLFGLDGVVCIFRVVVGGGDEEGVAGLGTRQDADHAREHMEEGHQRAHHIVIL